MSGWSDIALRARATTVIPSAVLYKAHAVLTRGRSTLEKGHLWIKGENNGVIRYVESPASNAHAAHLASGWKQDDEARRKRCCWDLRPAGVHGPQAALLDAVASPGWQNMPDSVAGEPAIAFWRDICASMCFRHHDDDVEMMEVDLRPGCTRATRRHVRPSRCACYAYDDLAKLNARGATPSPRSRTRRPTTWQWALPLDGQAGQQLRGQARGGQWPAVPPLHQHVRGAPRRVGRVLRGRGAVDRLLQARARAGVPL